MRTLSIVLLVCCALLPLLTAASQPPRVAIIGGGVGGTAAAYFLRKENPSWHVELFEREECLGGRTREVVLDGKVLELGASIIHGANSYMLSLAGEVGLTLAEGDDTGAAFSIWDGRDFVFAQTGSALRDFWAVAKRYGVTPLRYKWLSQEAGRRFGGIYDLQQRGTAFTTPEAWLQRLGLFNATQQRAADFMTEHLTQGVWRFGSGAFIEELAGAINRINYNQNNTQLNALAGLVSYLPAADPEVYSIKEGNAALPNRLAAAAQLQGLHTVTAVSAVSIDSTGHYTLTVTKPQPPTAAAAAAADAAQAGTADSTQPSSPVSSPSGDYGEQQQQQQKQQQQQQELGPFDSVIIATPLEGSGLQLQGLDPQPHLPPRTFQQTTTTFVTGYLDAGFFERAVLEPGDVFVTNSAHTPFSVVASKGAVSVEAVPQEVVFEGCSTREGPTQQQQDSEGGRQQQQGRAGAEQQQEQQKPGQEQDQAPEQIPLWKVFSEQPLSWHDLRTMFVNGTVVATRSWAAYPRFQPPERFASFLLGPGLCYNNALENAASAMEVAAVAAKNCALLVQQHVKQQQQQQQQQQRTSLQQAPGHIAVE